MQVLISVKDDLLKEIDDYAKEHYTSRSQIFTMGATQLVMQRRLVNALFEMSSAFQMIAEKGTVDQDTLDRMKQIETLADMMRGERL